MLTAVKGSKDIKSVLAARRQRQDPVRPRGELGNMVETAMRSAAQLTAGQFSARKDLNRKPLDAARNVSGLVKSTREEDQSKYGAGKAPKLRVEATVSHVEPGLATPLINMTPIVEFGMSMANTDKDAKDTIKDSHPYYNLHYLLHILSLERQTAKDAVSVDPKSMMARLHAAIKRVASQMTLEAQMILSEDGLTLFGRYDAVPAYSIPDAKDREEMRKKNKDADPDAVYPPFLKESDAERCCEELFQDVNMLELTLRLLHEYRVACVPFQLERNALVRFTLPINENSKMPQVNDCVDIMGLTRHVKIMPVPLTKQGTYPWVVPERTGEQTAEELERDEQLRVTYVKALSYWRVAEVVVCHSISSEALYELTASHVGDGYHKSSHIPTLSECAEMATKKLAYQGRSITTKALDWALVDSSPITFPLTPLCLSPSFLNKDNATFASAIIPSETAIRKAFRCFKADAPNKTEQMEDEACNICARAPITGFTTGSPMIQELEHSWRVNLKTLQSFFIQADIYSETLGAMFGLNQNDHKIWSFLGPVVMSQLRGFLMGTVKVGSSETIASNMRRAWNGVKGSLDAQALEDMMSTYRVEENVYEFPKMKPKQNPDDEDEPFLSDVSDFVTSMCSRIPDSVYDLRVTNVLFDPKGTFKYCGFPITAKRAKEVHAQIGRRADMRCIGASASERAYGVYNLSSTSALQPQALQQRFKNADIHFYVIPKMSINESQRHSLAQLTPEMGDIFCCDEYGNAVDQGKEDEYFAKHCAAGMDVPLLKRLRVTYQDKWQATPKYLVAVISKTDDEIERDLTNMLNYTFIAEEANEADAEPVVVVEKPRPKRSIEEIEGPVEEPPTAHHAPVASEQVDASSLAPPVVQAGNNNDDEDAVL